MDVSLIYFYWWRLIVLAFILTLPLFELHIRGILYEMKKAQAKEISTEKEKELFASLAVSQLRAAPKTFFDYLLLIFTCLSTICWLASFVFVVTRILIAIGVIY